MKLTEEILEQAIVFAKNRRETTGDAQAGSAEINLSYIDDDGDIVLRNKPLSGWRFPIVTLTRVSLSDIEK